MASLAQAEKPLHSYFYPPEKVKAARQNLQRYEWGAEALARARQAAEPWMNLSDDAMWALMFGNTITRSWMVWSNGYCPACKEGVPMYKWQPSAFERPWKLRCPHCGELFPKNDFGAYYRSGLDAHGVFDPALADRALLYNTEHPDPSEPLHRFGVDDGEGYREGDKVWRFIGNYLIYGIWRQQILSGLETLADAYILTGEPAYARKAGILLDRVADLYPTMDFRTQGLVYEIPKGRGYVSNWHSCCPETTRLVMVWDKIRGAMQNDNELVAFLSQKASTHRLDNPKATFADIRRNIEDGLLRDPLANKPKVDSNFPMTDVLYITIKKVLGTEESMAEAEEMIDAMIAEGIAYDGLSGEKGLVGYSKIFPTFLAQFAGKMLRAEPDFLERKISAFPRLAKTWRFHIDTHCLGKFYPLVADGGTFTHPIERYVAMGARKPTETDAHLMEPSNYTLLWRLYQVTGDMDYLRVLWKMNDASPEGLLYDLCIGPEENAEIAKAIHEKILEEGPDIRLDGVLYEEWRLAIARSGLDNQRRALWMHFGPSGRHNHADGMNLGLFAFNLSLLPECGYPAVQFGGWRSDRGRWYARTAAHNTVVVDRQDQQSRMGRANLWVDGEALHAFGAEGPDLIPDATTYGRMAALVDTPDGNFYVFDVFRVAGGKEHLKFTHSGFGVLQTEGLETAPPEKPMPEEWQLRHIGFDPSPPRPFVANWAIRDHFEAREPGAPTVQFRQTDLTRDAQAGRCEMWVALGVSTNEQAWIPRAVTRRVAPDDGPLQSLFVGFLEAWEVAAPVRSVERLDATPPDDAHGPVVAQVELEGGGWDLLVAHHAAPEAALSIQAQGARLETDASLALVRLDASGKVVRMALQGGAHLRYGERQVRHSQGDTYTEVVFEGDAPRTASRSDWQPAATLP